MSKRVGPSMSTEPGWMAERHASPLLLGEHKGPRLQNDPSMLLSFERPALAGSREDAPMRCDHQCAETGRRYTPLHGP
jgi:hypothetical protein